MSDHSRRPSISSSILSTGTCLDPQPVPADAHPLSPDPDDATARVSSTISEMTAPLEQSIGEWQHRRKAPSIRSSYSTSRDLAAAARKKPTHMRRSSSTSAPRAPNERNLIFDEWITSTAHPALAAFSLIPTGIVDDDKAVQDMLAEAMGEDTFVEVPANEEEEVVTSVEVVEVVDTPVPLVETRPRSSSTLSMRNWAGIFVGRGESRRVTAQPTRPKLSQKRSFSAPESITAEPADRNEGTNDVKGTLTTTSDIETLRQNSMSPSSSSDSIPSINITSSPPSKSSPHTLTRTNSAPQEPTPDQMRSTVARSINNLRSPTRLRATTLTTDVTRSRSGSDSTHPPALSQSSSSTSLTSLGQKSPAPVVEMERILPAEMQPPSLSAKWEDHYKSGDGGLTDRYGFIVASQRRDSGDVLDLRESLRERTRSDEVRWRSVASEAEDRIEELRKLGAKEKRTTAFADGWNSPAMENMSQGVVAMADMKIHSPTHPTSPLANEIFPVDLERESTSAPTVVPDVAPLTPSLTVTTPPIPTLSNPSELSTIKLLLSKLNDLHDSLDRANRQRWDKWLAQSDPTDSLLTPSHGSKDRKQRMRDFKALVMGGVPVKYRSKIWAECSGATEMSRPGYFKELCELGVAELDKISVQQIEMVLYP
jgi:hypothetical protein